MQVADIESAAGSVSQVRESTVRLMRDAKTTHVPVIIVGHVTKEGAIAGPRVLEHIVDTVLYLEGDALSHLSAAAEREKSLWLDQRGGRLRDA